MLFGRPPDVAALKRARDIPGLTKASANRNKSIAAEAAEALGEIVGERIQMTDKI